MREDLLYFIWKYKLYDGFTLFDVEENLEIISTGEQNYNSGPDFLDAKIKTGDTTWVGNVEIHVKSSDWNLHGHQQDKAYNNVILQVVKKHDKEVYTEGGRLVPVMELKINKLMEMKYQEFVENKSWIPCQSDIHLVNEFKLKMWLGKVLIERLNKKTQHIRALLDLNKSSWEETFYQLLARSFGFKINADPFEWLAKSVPLKFLVKHQNNLMQLEAILFGQAGFLHENDFLSEYYNSLRTEYEFLRKKFNLTPLEKHLWKFLRLRPSNFPCIRISQFAALVSKSKSLFSKIVNASSLNEIKVLFKVTASSFWDVHYTFDKNSEIKPKVFGEDSINSVLINTVIPILFVYGQSVNNDVIKEKALNFLEELKPEINHITRGWKQIGIEIPSSFYSQALLEQKSFYCNSRRCLNCGIGIEILKNQRMLKTD